MIRHVAAALACLSLAPAAHAQFDDAVEGQVWYEPNGDPCVGSPLLPHGLRTVDGRWNNLHAGQTHYGAAREIFPRLLEPEFRDAEPIPAGAPGGPPGTPTSYAQQGGFVYDSEPRAISNLIVDQTTDNPAAVAKLLEFLEESDVVPGRAGTLTAASPDGTTTVEIEGRHVGIGAFASQRILVTT